MVFRNPIRRSVAAIMAVAVGLMLWGAWRSIDLVDGEEPRFDSGLYLSLGYHVANGALLYRDVWESKQPGIIALHAILDPLGNGRVEVIRTFERWCSLLRTICLCAIIWIATKRLTLALFASLMFQRMFYEPGLFQGGNLTEEYGTTLALVGALFVLTSVRSGGRGGAVCAGAAGVALALAAMFKTPFLLSGLGWFIVLAIGHRARGTLGGDVIVAFFAGGGGAVGVLLLSLFRSGTLIAWVDMLHYNVSYSGLPKLTVGTKLIVCVTRFGALIADSSFVFLAFIVIALWQSLRRRAGAGGPQALLRGIAVALALDLAGSCLSNKHFGHYFMQVVGTYVVFAAICGEIALRWYARVRRRHVQWLVMFSLVGALFVDFKGIAAFVLQETKSCHQEQWTELVAFVRRSTSPEESIFVIDEPPGLYWACRRKCPVRYLVAHPYYFRATFTSSAEEKVQALVRGLRLSAPRLILCRDLEKIAALEPGGMRSFLAERYHLVIVAGWHVYDLKDS